jgi:hypothetical protein
LQRILRESNHEEDFMASTTHPFFVSNDRQHRESPSQFMLFTLDLLPRGLPIFKEEPDESALFYRLANRLAHPHPESLN